MKNLKWKQRRIQLREECVSKGMGTGNVHSKDKRWKHGVTVDMKVSLMGIKYVKISRLEK